MKNVHIVANAELKFKWIESFETKCTFYLHWNKLYKLDFFHQCILWLFRNNTENIAVEQRGSCILNTEFLSRDIINYCLGYISIFQRHFNSCYRLDIEFRNLFKVDQSDNMLKNICLEVPSLQFVLCALEPIVLSWLAFSSVLWYHQGPVWMTWKKASLSNVWILLMGLYAIKSILHGMCQVFN